MRDGLGERRVHGRPGVVRRCIGPIVVAIGLATALAACGQAGPVTGGPVGRTGASTAPGGHRSGGTDPTAGTTTGAPTPPASTVVATPRGTVPRFAYPGGPEDGLVPATWHDALSTLPVVGSRPGWFEVRLAQRPNGSTAWVLASDVTTATSPYAIVVDLATRRLLLYRDGRTLLSAPAGVGLPAFPTPTGQYFVAFFAAPPSPGYGAFVMVTSAHSDTITDWEESGDAMIAIHGPLGSDAQIGTTGAAISHGCIRLHETDLQRLRQVPVGSPVDIVS